MEAKDPTKVPLSHVLRLPRHTYDHKFMPTAYVEGKEWDYCHEKKTIFLAAYRVCPLTCLLIHGTYNLLDYSST